MKALVLVNPAARATADPRRLENLLSDSGVESRLVDDLGQDLVSKFDLLVCWGGDGTLHRALPYLVRHSLRVLLIPGGTANVLARELGLPSDLEEAVKLLDVGSEREVYLGRTGERYFHLMTGIGTDAYLLGQVQSSLKKRLGILAFWWTGLTRFWSYPLPQFSIRLGEQSIVGTCAVVSNCRTYGAHLEMAPRGSVFKPELDLCVFKSQSHFRYVRYLWGSFWGRHLRYPDVDYREIESVGVDSSTPVRVQLDGESAGCLPVRIFAADARIQMLLPPSTSL